ncbi:MAG: hypothetical protein SF172_14745 [Burkholderiales bacterium]|nr:hypothetical protein [Burkholderiales bacterium]
MNTLYADRKPSSLAITHARHDKKFHRPGTKQHNINDMQADRAQAERPKHAGHLKRPAE